MEAFILFIKTHPLTKFKIVMHILNLLFSIISCNGFLVYKGYEYISPKEVGFDEVISFILSKELLMVGIVFLFFYTIYLVLFRGFYELILTLVFNKFAVFNFDKSVNYLKRFIIFNDNVFVAFRNNFSKKTVQRLIILSGNSQKLCEILEICLASFSSFILSHFIIGSPLNLLFAYSDLILIISFILFFFFCLNIIINTAKSENISKTLMELSKNIKSTE